MEAQLARQQTGRAPNFIGIGAQRGATTWLFQCMKAHPELYVPPVKEVHYFNKHYDRGWDWYVNHFADATPNQLVGEITPNYLDSIAAAQRMGQDCPTAKLFVVLREPVSRAISSYELLGDGFSERSFEEACQPGRYLVELGLYAKHLKRFYHFFPREQLKVLLFDDIKSEPEKVLSELCEYLGVSQVAPPKRKMAVNTTAFPRVQRVLEGVGLGSVTKFAKSSPLSSPIRWLANRARDKDHQRIDRARIHQFFRQDILELQSLIDRDLSAWLM